MIDPLAVPMVPPEPTYEEKLAQAEAEVARLERLAKKTAREAHKRVLAESKEALKQLKESKPK